MEGEISKNKKKKNDWFIGRKIGASINPSSDDERIKK